MIKNRSAFVWLGVLTLALSLTAGSSPAHADGDKKSAAKSSKASKCKCGAKVKTAVAEALKTEREEAQKRTEQAVKTAVAKAVSDAKREHFLAWITEAVFVGAEITLNLLEPQPCENLRVLTLVPKARHGWVPKDKDLLEQLVKMPWYKPNPALTEEALANRTSNAVDQLNQLRLNQAMRRKACLAVD